jgi:hypothetical protein
MDQGEEHELGGAWGVGAFENPRALQWVAGLVSRDDLEPVRATLRRVVDSSEAPDEDLCMDALAGAEIILVALGRESGDVPPEVRTWAKAHGDGWTATDVRLAMKAVRRICADSGLKEFWDEVDDLDEWLGEVNDVAARLSRLVDSH